MNKTILSIFIAAFLCLLSCSPSGQDDPFMPTPSPGAQQTSISFGGESGIWQDANKTKAAAHSNASATRGDGETGLETLFNSFKVWGYKTVNNAPQLVMDGYQVEYQNESLDESRAAKGEWKYEDLPNTNQTVKYWDYSASEYRFFAYAPADAQGVASNKVSHDDATPSTLELNIPYKYSENATNKSTPYLSELWLSQNPSSSTPSTPTSTTSTFGSTVKLTFAPLTAKVRFMFKYPENANADHFKITEISFRDERWQKNDSGDLVWIGASSGDMTPTSGTITATYPLTEASTPSGEASPPSAASPSPAAPSFTWSNTSQDVGKIELTIPYEVKEDGNIHQNTDEENWEKWYYVPPFEDIIKYTQNPYIITAKLNGSPISATVASEYMQWQAGYQYTYTFKISESGDITFATVDVEKWNSTNIIENNGSGTKDW